MSFISASFWDIQFNLNVGLSLPSLLLFLLIAKLQNLVQHSFHNWTKLNNKKTRLLCHSKSVVRQAMCQRISINSVKLSITYLSSSQNYHQTHGMEAISFFLQRAMHHTLCTLCGVHTPVLNFNKFQAFKIAILESNYPNLLALG